MPCPSTRHILVDCWGVRAAIANSAPELEALLRRAAAEAGATVLGARSHAFDPYGATAFVLLAESHIALHSWPELEYVSFDVLLCGGSAHRAAEVIVGELLPEQHRLHIVERGSPPLPVPAERPPR